MHKYIDLAKKRKMLQAMIISIENIYFDSRAILKCYWGCEDPFHTCNIKCHSRNTTPSERMEMLKQYKNILVVHSNNPQDISKALLDLERVAFLDGYYFAFALFACHLCTSCHILQGHPCPHPDKIRPCEQMFGIDVYQTVKNLGLDCHVLQNRNCLQNRYGFLFID